MRPGLIGFIVFAFIGLTLLDGVMLGQGGMLSTGLTADITSTQQIIYADTSGFPDASATNPQIIFIEEEEIVYTSKTATQFNIPANGRGVNNTSKVGHSQGKFVYNQEAQMVNETAGFNIVQAPTSGNPGGIDIVWSTFGYLRHAVPNMLYWNFSFLTGPAQYLALFLKALSATIVVGLAIMFISSIYGLLKT